MLPRELLVALAAGLAFGGVGLGVAFASARRRPFGETGLILAAATFAGWWAVFGDLSRRQIIAAAVLAGAGLAARRFSSRLLAAALALPGIWLAAGPAFDEPRWMLVLLLIGGPIAAVSVADFDRRHTSSGVALVLVAVTAFGIFATVPEPERAAVLLGAALPLGLVAWPHTRGSLGAAGSYALIGLVVAVLAADGTGRAGALIGGLASLGVLLVEPPARMFRSEQWPLLEVGDRTIGAPLAGLFQAAVVFGTARVAGLQHSAWAAGLLALVVLSVTGLVGPRIRAPVRR